MLEYHDFPMNECWFYFYWIFWSILNFNFNNFSRIVNISHENIAQAQHIFLFNIECLVNYALVYFHSQF